MSGIFGFGHQKTPQELARESKTTLNRETREIDRQLQVLDREDARTKQLIKEAARRNDMASAKALARQLVQSRKTREQFVKTRSHVASTGIALQRQVAQQKVATTIGKTANIMGQMNRAMPVTSTLETMRRFQQESLRADMSQEQLDDLMESLDEPEVETEADAEVDKVMTELTQGILSRGDRVTGLSAPQVAATEAAQPVLDSDLQGLSAISMIWAISRDGQKLIRISHSDKAVQTVQLVDTISGSIVDLSHELSFVGDNVTALIWLSMDDPLPLPTPSLARRAAQTPPDFLVLGFVSGWIRIVQARPPWTLVFAECYHTTPVKRLHVSGPACPVLHLLAVYGEGIVVRLDGPLLRQYLLYPPASSAGAADVPPGIPFSKWSLQGFDGYPADCLCLGPVALRPPTTPPAELLYRLLAVGHGTVVGDFEATDTVPTSTLRQAAAVATKLTSAVFSFARSFFAPSTTTVPTGPAPAPPDAPATPPRPTEATHEAIAVTALRPLRDPVREATWLALAPRTDFALVGDVLGRVALLDTELGAFMYMWKGYREAQGAFFCGPIQLANTSVVATQLPTDLGLPAQSPSPAPPAASPLDTSLLAALFYIPYRGVLEAWRLPHCVRLAAMRVGAPAWLLAPPPPFTMPHTAARAAGSANEPGAYPTWARTAPFLWLARPFDPEALAADAAYPPRTSTSPTPSPVRSPSPSPMPSSPSPLSPAHATPRLAMAASSAGTAPVARPGQHSPPASTAIPAAAIARPKDRGPATVQRDGIAEAGWLYDVELIWTPGEGGAAGTGAYSLRLVPRRRTVVVAGNPARLIAAASAPMAESQKATLDSFDDDDWE